MVVSILYCFPCQGPRDTGSTFSTRPMVACFQPTNQPTSGCVLPTNQWLRASNQPMVSCFQATNSPGVPRGPQGSPRVPRGPPGSPRVPWGPQGLHWGAPGPKS